MKRFFLIFFLISIVLPVLGQDKLDVEKINREIRKRGAKWIAAENWVTRLSESERRRLCGTIPVTPDPATVKILSLPVKTDLPDEFDWCDNGGDWVTPVRNQQNCGSCWIFSAIGQAETWWQIVNNNPQSGIDLSEQFILSCGGADVGTCDGGAIISALNYIQNTGVPPETCFPYAATDWIPCQYPAYLLCEDWQQQAVTIPGWGYVTLQEPIVENIKGAVSIHPVSVSFTVYSSFNAYESGVYEYTPDEGEPGDGHAVLVVGWSDADSCWICKNSWGSDWGEDGYFRIKWGSCDIGKNTPFIWNEMTGGEAMTVTPGQIDLTLSAGDDITETIQVENTGGGELSIASIDYGPDDEVPAYFHADLFNAYSGTAWWCGDAGTGGYGNYWLQYLETPVLDLSQTQNPALSFMTCWAVEDPAGAFEPWDGWDGCNVWISTDGGLTSRVLEPVTPAYTCRSLWSFGNEAEGWSMGVGVPGWAGSSDGWVSAEFDLSAYRTDQVVIRWAFASDFDFCTADDPALLGFFVDDILVADNGTVVFENTGGDDGSMEASGVSTRPVEWLSIENGTDVIPAYSTHAVNVHIATGQLEPGDYTALIRIHSNDTTAPYVEVPVTLHLQTAAVDPLPAPNTVPDRYFLTQNYPNPFNATTVIRYGLPRSSYVRIVVYNNSGRRVKTLISDWMEEGCHQAEWDGTDSDGSQVGSGLYIVRMISPDQVTARKILLVQ